MGDCGARVPRRLRDCGADRLRGCRRCALFRRADFVTGRGCAIREARLDIPRRWGWATIVACAAAALYAPDRLLSLRQGALEIGASSWPLLFIGRAVPAASAGEGATMLKPSWTWRVAAILIWLGFAWTLGQGFTLDLDRWGWLGFSPKTTNWRIQCRVRSYFPARGAKPSAWASSWRRLFRLRAEVFEEGRRGAGAKAVAPHVGGSGTGADADAKRAAGADGHEPRGVPCPRARGQARSRAPCELRRRSFARRVFGARRPPAP